jgi:hypothetical protein
MRVPQPAETRLEASGHNDVWFVMLVGLSAAAVGYLSGEHRTIEALALGGVPLAVWLLTRPLVPLLGLGASIPALMSVTGSAGGLHVAASDVLLVIVLATILLDGVYPASLVVATLRPLAWPVLPYAAVLVVLLVAHLGVQEVAQTAQRYELFILPLAAGSYAALKGQHVRVLAAYVLAVTLFALIWPIHDFGLQKNPTGQVIANAILLIAGVPRLRRLVPCLVTLVPGLFLTESRGALGALAIGLAVIIVLSGFELRPAVARVVPVVLIAVGVFALLPGNVRERVTTLTPGTGTPAAYSLHIRQQLSADARQIFREHPWLGVGVGGYARADAGSQTPSDDPHQVLLLQAAEGGYVLAAAWVALVAGSCLVLLRMRQSRLAVAGIAVLVATAAHGLTDVYWARGTPVLGWLLAGMACAVTYRRKMRGGI